MPAHAIRTNKTIHYNIVSYEHPVATFTFSTFAVRVEISEDGSGRVPRSHQSRPYQSFSLFGPDDFYFGIAFQVFLELGFEVSCGQKKENIFVMMRNKQHVRVLGLGGAPLIKQCRTVNDCNDARTTNHSKSDIGS